MPTKQISQISSLYKIILTDLFLAENTKVSTIKSEYFRGKINALRKILDYIEFQPDQNPADVLEWYVDARSDGWQCEALMPDGNHWNHAILRKGEYLAKVDLLAGYLILWKNKEEVRPKFPYKTNECYSTKYLDG